MHIRHTLITSSALAAVLAAVVVSGTLPSAASSGSSRRLYTIGSTIDARYVHITLNRVDEPVHGRTSRQPAAGMQFIAIELTIRNTGGDVIEATGNVDTIVYANNNVLYTPSYVRAEGCRALSGSYKIPQGTAVRACVLFEIPRTTFARKVLFIPFAAGRVVTGESDSLMWATGN